MTKETETAFAGIDHNSDDDADMPRWYRTSIGAHHGESHEFPTLRAAVKDLPKGEKAKVGYYDDDADEWREAPRHSAVVNPEWMGDGLENPDAPNSAVWNIPTNSYAVVNPMDAVGPLIAALRKHGDAGDVYGQVEHYRNGGEVHVDVVFGGMRIGANDSEERPYVLGLSFGWSHFGDKRLYAEPVVYDTRDGAAYRDLADARKRRHVMSSEDDAENTAATAVIQWWGESLAQLETVQDTLFQIIADARNYEIPFPSLPFNLEEYYTRLGLPTTYAELAADKIPASTREPDAFAVYHAMALTLTEEFGGKNDTLTTHMKKANEILHSPPKTVADAIEAKETELRNAAQSTLTSAGDEEQQAADALADSRRDIMDDMDGYHGNKARLRTLLTEADDASPSTDSGEESDTGEAGGVESDADESDESEEPVVMTDGGVDVETAEPDATLELTDDGIELPPMLRGYVGKFYLRTADITGSFHTTDYGLPKTRYYDGPIAAYPDDDGDYNSHLRAGLLEFETDTERKVFEIIDKRTDDDPEIMTDGGRDRLTSDGRGREVLECMVQVSDDRGITWLKTKRYVLPKLDYTHHGIANAMGELSDAGLIESWTDGGNPRSWRVTDAGRAALEPEPAVADGGRDIPREVGGYCGKCEHLVRTNHVGEGGVAAVCDNCGAEDTFLPVSIATNDAPIQPELTDDDGGSE